MKTFNDLKEGDFIYLLDDDFLIKYQIYSIYKGEDIFKFNFGKGQMYWWYDIGFINDCHVAQWVSDLSYIVNKINNEQ